MVHATREGRVASLRTLVARALGLDVEAVDPDRPLLELGLGSLHAVRLAADLAAALARPVAPTLLFEHPTLAAIAAHLDGAAAPTAAVAAAPLAGPGPLALVGMACRFPRAPDLEAYWRLLVDGVDASGPVPPDRWDGAAWHDPDPAAPGKSITDRAAFLADVRGFEPLFFGVSPREADELDPQQRLALELAWEALEDAGVPPRALTGSATGVYFASMWHDWADQTHADVAGMSAHRATGTANNLIANRVSYALGLRGPSLVVDTACSSALVALHLAAQALAFGDVDLALVGAVNLLLAPESMVFCSKFGGLARDGRCKAFDARADGFGRGEGGGVVVLKRLDRALADGDRVWAVLRGSAVNNNGTGQGLTAPGPRAQEDVLRAALARAGLAGRDVHVVEAHGTGTYLGDPIEAAALGAVYGAGRPAGRPLLVGSVKTNIGHTEGAAGLAGLIKTTLALHHRVVPASLHLHEPNPLIDFDALRLRVPTAPTPWPAPADAPGLAGVSAFGWGGTNAHVILEGPPPPPRWLALAADEPAALDARLIAARDAAELAWPAHAHDERSPARLRVAVVARTAAELRERLGAAVRRAACDGLHLSPALRDPQADVARPRVVFVCSPLGSQWPGMARGLLAEPEFAAAFDRCDRALAPHLGRSLRADLLGGWQLADDVVRAQPLLFAVQVALAATLRAFGARPDVVLGHSAGEIAAAHIAGALDLEQAAEVVAHYARVQRPSAGRGAMAVVALPAEQLRPRLDARLAVAAHNSPASTVVSGDAHALAALLADLQRDGAACSPIRTDVAGHSPLVQDALPELARALAGLQPAAPTVPLISSVTAAPAGRLDGAYWARNLGEPVRFREAIEPLLAGPALFVELGPHPVLARAISECAAHVSAAPTILATLRRGADDRLAALDARAALFAAGVAADPPQAPELVVLSARSRAALAQSAERLAERLARDPPALRDLAHTLDARRTHLGHRLAVVAATPADLAGALRLAAPAEPPRVRPRLIFVFPGQGSQWPGMARRLFADEPAFRDALLACDRALAPHLDGSVIAELHAAHPRFDRNDVVQPVLWAVGLALAAQWRAWGVVPDAVVGHSMGEITAACCAGALDLADGARLIAARSRIARGRAGGAMAVVELDLDAALAAVAAVSDRLVVGVHNGPRECVLSGDPAALTGVLAELDARGVFTRRVKVDYASHGPDMDAVREPLRAALHDLSPRPGAIPMLSTLTADWQPGEGLGVDYWVANIRERVRYAEAVERLLACTPGAPSEAWRDQPRVLLELSPHPVLLAATADGLRARGDEHRALACLRRDEDERAGLLAAAGALFTAGVDVDLTRVRPGGRVVSLPPVAWQRTPHWHAAPSAPPAPPRAAALLGAPFTSPALPGARCLAGRLAPDAPAWLADHRVGDSVVVPAALWIDLALGAAATALGDRPRSVADARFPAALVLPPAGADIQVVLTTTAHGARFECHGRAGETWTTHATGTLHDPPEIFDNKDVPSDSLADPSQAPHEPDPSDSPTSAPEPRSGDDFYAALARRGLAYGPALRGVRRVRAADGRVDAELVPGLPAPVLLDAALHALVAGLPDDGRPLVPVGVRALRVHAPLAAAARATGRLHAADPPTADLEIHAADGRLLLALTGLELRRLAGVRVRHDDLLAHEWHDLPPAPAPTARPRRWLLAPAPPLAAPHLSPGPAAPHLSPGPDDLSPGPAAPHLSTGPAAPHLSPGPAAPHLSPGPAAPHLSPGPGDLAGRLADLLARAGDHARVLRPGDDLAALAGPWDGVVHLAAAPPAGFTWTQALDVADAAVQLTAALLARVSRDAPRLYLVTRGATAVDPAPPALAHAPLHGLGLTLAYEHPELRCTRVDLSADPDERELHALVAELRAADDEPAVALRGDRRRGARLVRGAVTPGELDLAGAHLITGGLGDLGLALAEWLVARGARHLALVGRGGVTHERQSAALARLREAGARVDVHRLDVADHAALAAVFAGLPDLAAAFHAAGVLDDRLLVRQDRDSLARALAPKLAGAWNLHLLTRDRPRCRLVLYSSVASLVGSPGQSNYAAASACLDALAEHRRALGLPALAVHWGAFTGLGLAARDARRGERLAGRGMLPLTIARAHEHLALLLADPSLTRIGVAPLDLRQWQESHLAVADAPLFRGLRGAAPPPRAEPDELRASLLTAAPEARARTLEDFVRAQALRVLRVDPARVHRHVSLVELGLDSLTGLELRNHLERGLGLRLPAALAWTHPRLADLAAELDARLRAEQPAAPPAPPAPATPDDELTAMSDDDLMRALSEELGLPA